MPLSYIGSSSNIIEKLGTSADIKQLRTFLPPDVELSDMLAQLSSSFSVEVFYHMQPKSQRLGDGNEHFSNKILSSSEPVSNLFAFTIHH